MMPRTTLRSHIGLASRAALVMVALCSPAAADPDEPIAYVGHGAFFDAAGRQITPTPEFVAKAQEWYRAKLSATLTAEKRAAFARFENQLGQGLAADGQARLLVQQRLVEWLAANSPNVAMQERTLGKLNALRYALRWHLPDRDVPGGAWDRQEFRISPELENKLKLPISGGVTPFSATVNTGQAYLNECAAAGVPIPPPINQMDPAGLTGWKSQGFIPTGTQFIVGSPAEVRTFRSTAPPGMCIALPRYSDGTKATVALDGVICLGQATSKVCIWDNQMPQTIGGIRQGVGFSFPAGTRIPIGVPDLAVDPAGRFQAGGFDLNNGSGGVCTDCHAGQNPYIIHPNADLGGGVLMGDLNQSPLSLPTFAAGRYDPLVPVAWPQNQRSQSPALVPSACSGCHQAGGAGGRFPHLSTEISAGYCNTILKQAIEKTMPPSNPGSAAGSAEVVAFQNWCAAAPTAGPSDRSDPHLTTTNGINYDFQAGGEFTALRNSDTRFELQTRQTPVSTVATPLANAYTGLASCVSLNTAVAARIGKHRISFQPRPGEAPRTGQLELRVNGNLAALPPRGLDLGEGSRIARTATGGGLDITAADGTHLIVTPNLWAAQNVWYLNVEVLGTAAREGTMGHILSPDWLPRAPDGSSFGPAPAAGTDRHTLLNRKFADAWRVTASTSLFDYGAGTSSATFTDRNWPPDPGKPCKATIGIQRPPEPLRTEIALRRCSILKDKQAIESCAFDAAAMGDMAVIKAYLQSLTLRAQAIQAGP